VVVPGFEFSKFELAPPDWEPNAASFAQAPPIAGVAAAEAISRLVPPPRLRTVVTSSDGVRLVVYEWGEAAGPAILFIHGSYQSALSWMKQVSDPRLAFKYRLVACDLRGHGASGKPAGPEHYRSPQRWADDVSAVLEGLSLDRPVVVAWSYGARVLNDYLQANGDGRLGGVVYVDARSTYHGQPDPAGAAGEEISKRAASEDPETFIAGTREFVLHCLERPLSSSEVNLLTQASMQTPQYVRQAMAGRSLTYEPVLSAIRVPALVVHGEADRVVSPAVGKFTHALIADSRLSLYPGVGHSPFLEDPVRFNNELDAFVSRGADGHRLD
jgi:pimeloyl-ACP methyl ester carboxylesterase